MSTLVRSERPTTAPRRRWSAAPGLVGAAVVVLLLAAIGFSTEYRSKAAAEDQIKAETFDPVDYGAKTYQSKVVPAIQQSAVELPVLLAAITADKDAAGAKYGKRQGTGPYSFAVKGTGVAGEVKGNLLSVEVPDLPGEAKVWLQIGPAINGTALRDAAGFIKFGDFRNQVDYADAATALNNEMRNGLLKNLDPAALNGKRVTFTGAFTLLTPDTVNITPIALAAS